MHLARPRVPGGWTWLWDLTPCVSAAGWLLICKRPLYPSAMERVRGSPRGLWAVPASQGSPSRGRAPPFAATRSEARPHPGLRGAGGPVGGGPRPVEPAPPLGGGVGTELSPRAQTPAAARHRPWARRSRRTGGPGPGGPPVGSCGSGRHFTEVESTDDCLCPELTQNPKSLERAKGE